MRYPKPLFFGVFAFSSIALALVAPIPATACHPSPTLGELYARADAAILVQWLAAEKATREKPGSTTYEVVQVARARFNSAEEGKAIEAGKPITVESFHAGKKGNLVLLLGNQSKKDSIVWRAPLDVSAASYNYIVEAPARETNPEQRLGYYLQFLEHHDRLVAADAFAEFANAPSENLVSLRKQFQRESLRQWLVSTDVPATRAGLYGLMLGLCGEEKDSALMHGTIMESTQDFRIGIDRLMLGYLLLTGEKGLVEIEKSKIQDKQVAFSETYAAMIALRFLWTHGDGRISDERLKASMRLLLDRPEVADLAIRDLYRWKDWGVQTRLMELYGAGEYNIPCIKRAIIRYMLASTKDVPAGGDEKPLRHVTDGSRYIEMLRTKDAKMVSAVERSFISE